MIQFSAPQGDIHVLSDAITTLAGAAATSCFGVRGMAKRSMSDGLVHLLRREVMGKGVLVHYHEDNAISIDLHIVVNFGVNLKALTKSIMDEVRYKVETAVQVTVTSVNVYVDSMQVN